MYFYCENYDMLKKGKKKLKLKYQRNVLMPLKISLVLQYKKLSEM